MSQKLVTLEGIRKHTSIEVDTGINIHKKNGICTLQLNFTSNTVGSWKVLGTLPKEYAPVYTIYTFALVNGISPLDAGCMIMITSSGVIQYITSRMGVNFLCTATYVTNEQ